MEHLDPDEEDEEGEASASTHARNKAITALLGGSSPKNNAADSYDEDSDGDEKMPGVRPFCSFRITSLMKYSITCLKCFKRIFNL